MNARLLLLASLVALLSAACGEVRKCKQGAPGCFAGRPDNGECDNGLVVVNGTCAEPDKAAPPLTCNCREGQVCTLDGYRCVDYCAPTDTQIGTQPATPLPACEPALGFDALCRNACLASCRQRAEYCDAPCADGACDGPQVLSACHRTCDDADDPVRCMVGACADTRALGCREVLCAGQRSPNCENVLCRNNCNGYNFDGICDDGDFKSASSGVCNYGSDCADCGPRRGAAPSSVAQGQPCAFHSNCRGHDSQNLERADAWCIEVDPARKISRCAPDCSEPGETCPEGSACFTLSFPDRDGDGSPDTLVQGERTASACFPVQCGS